MYQAKLLKLSKLIEEEVYLDVNGLKFMGFASVCPYTIVPNNVYPVNITMMELEGLDPVESKQERYGLKKNGEGFGYILYGKVLGDSIDIGNGIKIEDAFFKENPYLNNQFIELKVDRLTIEFL